MSESKKPVRKPRTDAAASSGASRKGAARDAHAAAVRASGVETLGEVVTWAAGDGKPFAGLVAELKAAGLDEKVAREMAPKHAFTRAAAALSDARVIDKLREEGDDILFQFTRREMDTDADRWKYNEEAVLRLDKVTGRVSCPGNQPLADLAQEELDKAIDNRTGADISNMVKRLFDARADLFPLRDQGGVYFVPRAFEPFTDQIDQFLRAVGGRINRWPIPAGVPRAEESVGDAIMNGLAAVAEDHREAVEEFALDSRRETMERQAQKIQETRVKVEAYADLLKDKAAELLKSLDDARQALKVKVAAVAAGGPAATKGVGPRYRILGYDACAVIRWMGKHSWTFREAAPVVARFPGCLELAQNTVRCQLSGGRDGSRGEPAALTGAETDLLNRMKTDPDLLPEVTL